MEIYSSFWTEMIVYRRNNQLEKAVLITIECLNYFKSKQNFLYIFRTLMELSILFLQLSDLKEVKSYIDQSSELLAKLNQETERILTSNY